MLNIVHDNLPHGNVWFPQKIYEVAFSFRHNKPLPFFFHLYVNLTFHTSADGLDSFIYPIVMADPYIQCRLLVMNSNPFGFWSHVSDSVIQGLREKRGWIIIDLYSEPITQRDFIPLIEALSDSSQFPNDRILLNITSPHFTDNKQVFCHPSFLEMGCYVQQIQKSYGPCLCTCGFEPEAHYPRKRFLLLNNHMDYPVAQVFAKYAKTHPTSFLDSSNDTYGSTESSSTFVHMPQALYENDFNVVLEGYVDNDEIEYPFITEKTYRNFRCKKPFILMGNRYSYKVLLSLGYKTFHPLINESFDTYETRDRCKVVLNELENLRTKTDAQWDSFLRECEPIVEHNYNNLLSRIKQTKAWLEGLKDL